MSKMIITRDPSRFELPDGSDLRQLRILAGLSLKEAAERANISKRTIRRWERGECEPRISDCRRLLQIYVDAAEQ